MSPWLPSADELKAMQMKLEPLGFVEVKTLGGRPAIADAESGEVLQFVTAFDLDRLWWTAKGWNVQLHEARARRMRGE